MKIIGSINSSDSSNNPVTYLNDITDIKAEAINDEKIYNNSKSAAGRKCSYDEGCDVQKFRRLV